MVKHAAKDSLTDKARRGGVIVGVSNALKFLLTTVRMVVVARLLKPEDIGIMGIVLFNIAIVENFSQTGFASALIQQKNRIESYLDTAQIISIFRGLALFLISYCTAPLLSSFFNTEAVTALLQVAAAGFLVEGLVSVGSVSFRKELEFKQVFLLQQAEVFFDILVTIVLAVALKNTWALVVGFIAGKVARCLASYLVHPYRPGLSFDFRKATEMFRYGRYLFGSSIIILLITQGDDAVVGKILGATALGFYVMAYKISNLTATSITHVFAQVAFPVYAKLQEDIPGLRAAYIKALKYIAFAAFPVCGGIIALAPEIVTIFLGGKWLEIVPSLQILAIFGLIRSLSSTTGPLFQGVGQPDIITKFSFGKLVFMAALIVPLTTRYGIIGTSVTVTVAAILTQFVLWRICAKIIKGKTSDIFYAILPSFSVTAAMMIFLLLLKTVQVPVPGIILGSGLILSGFVFYFASHAIFFRKDLQELTALLTPRSKNRGSSP